MASVVTMTRFPRVGRITGRASIHRYSRRARTRCRYCQRVAAYNPTIAGIGEGERRRRPVDELGAEERGELRAIALAGQVEREQVLSLSQQDVVNADRPLRDAEHRDEQRGALGNGALVRRQDPGLIAELHRLVNDDRRSAVGHDSSEHLVDVARARGVGIGVVDDAASSLRPGLPERGRAVDGHRSAELEAPFVVNDDDARVARDEQLREGRLTGLRAADDQRSGRPAGAIEADGRRRRPAHARRTEIDSGRGSTVAREYVCRGPPHHRQRVAGRPGPRICWPNGRLQRVQRDMR
jgi:hypothetical protein